MTGPNAGAAAGLALARRPNVELIGLAALRKLVQMEPRGFLWDRLIPAAGITLILGAPLTGKTRLMVGLAVACALGVPLAGRSTPDRPRTVVWVGLEHSRLALLEHFSHAAKALGCDDPDDLPIHFLSKPSWRIDDSDEVAALLEKIEDVEADVVIIDTVRRAGAFDENRSDDVREVMGGLAALTSQHSRAVLGLHHPNSSGRPRGSTDFEGASDSILSVERRGKEELILRARHHDAAEASHSLRIVHETDRMEFLAQGGAVVSPRQAVDGEAERAILGVLTSQGPHSKTMLRKAVSTLAGYGSPRCDQALQHLLDTGRVMENEGPRRARVFSAVAPSSAQDSTESSASEEDL